MSDKKTYTAEQLQEIVTEAVNAKVKELTEQHRDTINRLAIKLAEMHAAEMNRKHTEILLKGGIPE